MKKTSLFLVAIFCAFATTFAHGYGNHYHGNAKSKLNVQLWNHSSFKITFGNNVFHNTNNFNLGNIRPGLHYVRVEKVIPNPYGNGAMKRLLYKGQIEIPANARVIATVGPRKTIKVNVQKNCPPQFTHNYGCGYANGYSCNCMNDNYGYYNDDFGQCGTGNGGYYDDFNGGDFGWNPNPNNPYGEDYYYMSDRKFNDLMNSMNKNSFDSGRLKIAEQALRNEQLKTEQVSQLMKQLTFESNKLKLAKMAYNKTIDKENYFRVNDQFTFNSSINKLNDFIERQG